jgi:hypothetical protein
MLSVLPKSIIQFVVGATLLTMYFEKVSLINTCSKLRTTNQWEQI